MLKLLSPDVWVYDVEWAIDPFSCCLVYGLPLDTPPQAAIEHAYAVERAKQEKYGREPDATPMVKTSLCRVVAISALKRTERRGTVRLQLKSMRGGAGDLEREAVDRFLTRVGQVKPQLVGFSSRESDMPVLLQRAVAYGLHQPQFGSRPEKPWLGVDYFAKQTDFHIDLLDILSNYSRGKQMPSLHEACVTSGIPGKFLAGGKDVTAMWLAGETDQIVRYNQCDVLSEYELLMRVALFAGLIEPEAYHAEERTFTAFLDELAAAGEGHVLQYRDERERLRNALGIVRPNPAPAEDTEPPQLELTAPAVSS